mmetsp:Transcript_37342/g.35944  ORF Transcript_37342/g.35944 Transcript_37342/m.35944 type:complete len:155 (-) Transcript_37342:192-656(-)
MFVLMVLNYKHSLISIKEGPQYMFCMLLCLFSINKIFYSACIFTVVYDKDNHPKNSFELFVWRVWYDLMVLVITVSLTLYASPNSFNLILVTLGPLFIMESILYFLSVRPAIHKARQLDRFYPQMVVRDHLIETHQEQERLLQQTNESADDTIE